MPDGYRWRALGVVDTSSGPDIEVVSGPVGTREELELPVEGVYDRVVVQRQRVGEWETVEER
jgi:hypothetical protein